MHYVGIVRDQMVEVGRKFDTVYDRDGVQGGDPYTGDRHTGPNRS